MTFRGNHVDELISASLTGDLSDAERAELDAHLARCERCRATLAAFKSERRILSGLPVVGPPRDLSARVRAGIESGQMGQPWWRRPSGLVAIGASVATVAAAILAIVVFGNLDLGPVGSESGAPSPSSSLGPTPSAVQTLPATTSPSPIDGFALGPGDLGYLSLNGASFEASRLTFINDATGASIDAGTVSGPPIAASLSPDRAWLAYITRKGETGANEVWAVHLTDGEVVPLGCSIAAPFTDRLTWSPTGELLAFTVAAIDLGSAAGCSQPTDEDGTTRVWVFSTVEQAAAPLAEAGPGSYAASFVPFRVPDAANQLWVSQAGEMPISELMVLAWPGSTETSVTADGVFLPLLSPDGSRAIFWSGTMAESGGSWQFSTGGIPQLSGDFRSARPTSPWIGTPLFTDLTPVGGEAFASGKFVWGPDSDLIAFWDGAWTGVPQSADGTYPSQQGVYVGRISTGLLSAASKLGLIRPKDSYIVDVAFSPDGKSVAVTIGLPSAGVGDPPSAYLEIVPLDGSTPHSVGGGADPPPWNGPAVFGR